MFMQFFDTTSDVCICAKRHPAGKVCVICLYQIRYANVYFLQMPVMDGLQASRIICERWPKNVRPYLVAVTANAMQGDKDLCLAAGMDSYIR
jgi:DNA-binding NarL/FixJ family response regulator